MKKVKKILIILCLVLVVGFVSILLMKNDKIEIKESSNDKKSGLLSFMVEKSDGTYEEKQATSWPSTDEYAFNSTLSRCERDSKLKYDSKNNKVQVTASGSDKCYIYFDLYGGLKIISGNTSNLYANQAGMYRYQGSQSQVTNNYICFGTSNKDECLASVDKFMYRIIGITNEGVIKVIKDSVLATKYPYNSTNTTKVEWPDSDLFEGLNGSYFLKNTSFDYLQNENWLNRIVDYEWMHGSIQLSDPYSSDIDTVYNIEIGNADSLWKEKVDNSLKGQDGITCTNSNYGTEVCYRTFNEKWNVNNKVKAKIGLMYKHDYYFSPQKDGFSCVFSSAIKYGVVNPICANNWLNNSTSNEHIITQIGYFDGANYYNDWVLLNGVINNYPLNESRYVRPVFYIKSNVLTTGTGVLSDPYLIM